MKTDFKKNNYGNNKKKKLKAFFFFTLLLLINISTLSAQTAKVSISLKSATVKQLFKAIEAQSNYSFSYRETAIRTKEKITLTAEKQTVKNILLQVLSKRHLSYTMDGNTILITTSQIKKKTIKGVVLDRDKNPLIGVSVRMTNNSSIGTITDFDGKFTLNNIPENSKIEFSYIGYKKQNLPIKEQMQVVLNEDNQVLDEVVVVGYGTQRKGNLTGSIATVKADKLATAPLASTTNALAGRLPGLISVQKSGQPGDDAAKLSIRGFGDALVIVDGIESSFNNIDANQIESVTILKDGASSIYGARAGNGVILVTTKRGTIQKPIITLGASHTWQGVTNMLKPVNAGQMVELKREAHFNAGGTEENAPYTKEAMDKYYKGTDPLFPNTDWYKEIFRDWAPQQKYSLSVRGGSKKIKYYGYLGFMDQKTMVKKNGGGYKRYNLQSNIDASITDNFSFQLDIAGIHEEKDYTARDMGVGGYMWQDYWTTLPIYHAHFPDPTKVPYADGGGTGGIHVTSNSDLCGYNQTRFQQFKSTIVLKYKFPMVKGLTAKLFGNYIQNYTFRKTFTKPVKLYSWDPATDTYATAGSYGGKASLNHDISKSRNLTLQASLNFERLFNKVHRVSAIGLFECIDFASENVTAARKDFLTKEIDYLFAGSSVGMSNGGNASEMGRASFVGRLSYAYKDRYLLETILRADASAKFSSSTRWGYFPSVSLGWVMSEEPFIKKIQAIDHLKLRLSYGKSGNDAVGNFQYLSAYQFGYRYVFGNQINTGLVTTGLANELLTWEKINIYNAGIDFSLLNHKLYGELDVFYRKREGIPATRTKSLPSTFGAKLPEENLNSLSNRGFELNIGTKGEFNKLKYDINANISWSRAKWEHYEEPNYTDPDQRRLNQKTGHWVDRQFGYKTNGLFTSQAQIDALGFNQDGKNNATLKPGDIRFIDVNGDKVLDWKDQVEIGKGKTPHWMFGTNINLTYKNFDLSMLFQGAFDFTADTNIGAGTQTSFEKRWTETNNDAHAIVPRLGSTATTSGYYSDYYHRDASYVRLKVASLGYSLPQNLLSSLKFHSVRFYVSGTNLLTFSGLTKFGIDPEAPNVGWYYPQQRTICFGVDLSF